jgi:lipopolysaccharide biosynthesis glycosyltransferase
MPAQESVLMQQQRQISLPPNTKHMRRPALEVVFLFDASYLGAALVSAASFLAHCNQSRHRIALVYLSSGTPEDTRVAQVLHRFTSGLASRHPTVAIDLVSLAGSVFDSYVPRHHFSKAILYKLALPKAFPHWSRILLLDCGMIFGKQLPGFLATIEKLGDLDTPPAVAAFCVHADSPSGLPKHLQALPHHNFYPDGGKLYFDTQRYTQADAYERFLAEFHATRDRLQYAEQDLLCLTLRGDELQTIPESGRRCRIDLADIESWSKVVEHQELHTSGDYFYIKHIGSFKPWRRWVLHPSKSIFLREQAALAALIGNDGLQAIRDTDLFPSNTGFLAQQLLQLEAYYAHNPLT